jgi:hypothetical protein
MDKSGAEEKYRKNLVMIPGNQGWSVSPEENSCS